MNPARQAPGQRTDRPRRRHLASARRGPPSERRFQAPPRVSQQQLPPFGASPGADPAFRGPRRWRHGMPARPTAVSIRAARAGRSHRPPGVSWLRCVGRRYRRAMLGADGKADWHAGCCCMMVPTVTGPPNRTSSAHRTSSTDTHCFPLSPNGLTLVLPSTCRTRCDGRPGTHPRPRRWSIRHSRPISWNGHGAIRTSGRSFSPRTTMSSPRSSRPKPGSGPMEVARSS